MRPRTKQRPMTPMLALGLRVQAIRQQRDWTQEKLAERCGSAWDISRELKPGITIQG
jgi:DNA-binding XRE family transcriptional regulator